MKTRLDILFILLMSNALLIGNIFICIDEHCDSGVTVLYEQVADCGCECASSDGCYNGSSSCNDIALDFDLMLASSSNFTGALILHKGDTIPTFPSAAIDTYQTALYHSEFTSPILEQLSTVILTT